MTSADAPLLERLLEAARQEVAAQQAQADAEEAYLRAWWTTTLLLAVDLPRGDVGPIAAAVAKVLHVTPSTVQERRNMARRIAPETIADGSIHRTQPGLARTFLHATGVAKIGPPEIVELQKLQGEGWSAREIKDGAVEIRTRLGIVEPPPTRASPRSRPTVRATAAQWDAITARLQRQRADAVALSRLADGALDVTLSHGSSVDHFQLDPDGAVIEGAA